MRRQIAALEHVPATAIQLVGYDKNEWNFDIDKSDRDTDAFKYMKKDDFDAMLVKFKDPSILISNVFKTKVVKYQIKDIKVPDQTFSITVYGDCITKDEADRVAKMYPFSIGCPHWVISMLLEGNNIDKMEETIKFFNSGGEMLQGAEDLP
jgi:hypothetical protein